MSPLLVSATLLASLVGCELLRRFAIRRALLDRPNERSLHQVPTPRLGGAALVLAVLGAASPAAIASSATLELRLLLGAGLGVAALGLLDDLRPLSAATRLVLQIGVALAVILGLGVPAFEILPGIHPAVPSAVTAAVLVLWIVGVLNIYNFMDGMDGLAGAQSIAAAIGQAVVLGAAALGDLAGVEMLVACAAAGFLLQNFPPARLFMGDAGSTFLGFVFAVAGVVAMKHGVSLALMALPLAPFLLDGTFTLLRRALRGEKVWKAHRTHLYQRAVQTGLTHREVLLVYSAWLSVAVIATQAASERPWAVYAGWAVTILGLIVVWRWVLGREASAPSGGEQRPES